MLLKTCHETVSSGLPQLAVVYQEPYPHPDYQFQSLCKIKHFVNLYRKLFVLDLDRLALLENKTPFDQVISRFR